MTDTPKKEKAPGANPTPQSPAAKPEIAKGDGIVLCKKDKRILRRIRWNVSNVLDSLDEIDNNITRFEHAFLVLNLRTLLEGICHFGKLPRALTGTLHRAKAMEARR